jgi:hypothetical protein
VVSRYHSSTCSYFHKVCVWFRDNRNGAGGWWYTKLLVMTILGVLD